MEIPEILKKLQENPARIKQYSLVELQQLAAVIREQVAHTCSENGGHFAPSLGVVELTMALHYVYELPQDKLVWDVGHQSYPHKLLTGRAGRFHTLRRIDGISGFPKRDESPYDAFGVGHASTAISAALGMALGRDRKKQSHRVVAICGDGAMTGGMCYEALNNLGYVGTDMVIILNDNRMSIAPNLGAMPRYFNQLLTAGFYNRSKETAEDLINRVPAVGKKMLEFSQRLERTIKDLIVPEETIFEKMGIRYLGPVDGHNLPELIEHLQHIRDLRGPILFHVKTIKGKGYSYSETDPERWHSGADFEVQTGIKTALAPKPAEQTAPTYTEVFGKTLVEAAGQDERLQAITAAMPAGTGLDLFAETYPERFYDVGIAESHAVCCAAGMACEGMRPVVAIYSSFLQRSFDNVIHDVALQKLPVIFALDRAGIVGDDGPTHHGVFDLSYLRMIPDMVVMAPRDENMLRRMLLTAFQYEDGPIALRYPRGKGKGVEMDGRPEPAPLGKGEVLQAPWNQNERRIALLGLGPLIENLEVAANSLNQAGLPTAVVDMCFVKPLDRALLAELCEDYDLLVTVEDNVLAGGFGSAVGEALREIAPDQMLKCYGIPDRWVEHGPPPVLFERLGLDGASLSRDIESYYCAHFPEQAAARITSE